MLRHTFATQLVNAGAKITTIQALLGHKRLNTTMTYARIHDKVVIQDYYQAMAKIEGDQRRHAPDVAKAKRLLYTLQAHDLTDDQRTLLAQVQDCLLLTSD